MTAIYFLIDSSNTVTNVFSWDGDVSNYKVPEGFIVKKRENDQGWMYSYWNGTKAIEPKPYPSWILAPDNETWLPPTPKPDDGKEYNWDEETLSWKEIIPEQPVNSGETGKIA